MLPLDTTFMGVECLDHLGGVEHLDDNNKTFSLQAPLDMHKKLIFVVQKLLLQLHSALTCAKQQHNKNKTKNTKATTTVNTKHLQIFGLEEGIF